MGNFIKYILKALFKIDIFTQNYPSRAVHFYVSSSVQVLLKVNLFILRTVYIPVPSQTLLKI